MTPEEALQILDQIAASVTGLNRQSHLAAMEATQVLRSALAELHKDGAEVPPPSGVEKTS